MAHHKANLKGWVDEWGKSGRWAANVVSLIVWKLVVHFAGLNPLIERIMFPCLCRWRSEGPCHRKGAIEKVAFQWCMWRVVGYREQLRNRCAVSWRERSDAWGALVLSICVLRCELGDGV